MPTLKGDIREYAGIGVLLTGVLVVALGAFFVAQGWSVKNEIRAQMRDEAVTTKIDDVELLVIDQRTATNQAELIKSHTFGSFGTYQSLDREDPRRATYITGLTLRNSLNLARMGLDVSNLVMGLGAMFLAVGAAVTTVGAVIAAGVFRVTGRDAEAAPDLHETARAEALT